MNIAIVHKTSEMELTWGASADLPNLRTPLHGVIRMAMKAIHVWPVWSLLPASLSICAASFWQLSGITGVIAILSVLSSILLMVGVGKQLASYATLAFLRHIERSRPFPLNALQAALAFRYDERWYEDDLQRKKLIAKMNTMLCRWLTRRHRSPEAAVASLRALCQEMGIRMSDLLGVRASFSGDDIAQLANSCNNATPFIGDLEWIRALMAIHHIAKMSHNQERIKLIHRTSSWLSKAKDHGITHKAELENTSDFLHRDAALRLLTMDANETTQAEEERLSSGIHQPRILSP